MTRALLVVDVMLGIFDLGVDLHRGEAFLANIELLISRARAARVPIVFVQHTGAEGSPFAPDAPGRTIHPRVAPRAGETIIQKRQPDSFQDTSLESVLREQGIEELVICGFASEACVDTTVRSAYAKGFTNILVSDAHTTTRNPVLEAAQIVAHHNFVLSRFAKVLRHDEVLLD
jgi:nicotinamidase-related amidase